MRKRKIEIDPDLVHGREGLNAVLVFDSDSLKYYSQVMERVWRTGFQLRLLLASLVGRTTGVLCLKCHHLELSKQATVEHDRLVNVHTAIHQNKKTIKLIANANEEVSVVHPRAMCLYASQGCMVYPYTL